MLAKMESNPRSEPGSPNFPSSRPLNLGSPVDDLMKLALLKNDMYNSRQFVEWAWEYHRLTIVYTRAFVCVNFDCVASCYQWNPSSLQVCLGHVGDDCHRNHTFFDVRECGPLTVGIRKLIEQLCACQGFQDTKSMKHVVHVVFRIGVSCHSELSISDSQTWCQYQKKIL